jgi:hypothetical protein
MSLLATISDYGINQGSQDATPIGSEFYAVTELQYAEKLSATANPTTGS